MRFTKFLLLIAGCLLVLLASVSARAAAGDLDPTFGTGGKVTTDFFGKADGIGDAAITPDGKIVAVCEGTGADGRDRSCVVRYKVNGSLDPTFGSNGKVTLPLGLHVGSIVGSIVVQPDGRIIAAGFKDANDGGDFAVIRLHRDGSFDTTFGVDGVATADFFTQTRDVSRDITLQPDGKIVAVGMTENSLLLAVARFNPDGSLDNTFGNGGRVAPGLAPGTETALGVALQPDNKIVVVGQVDNGAPTRNDFVLVRFQPNGSLDNTFGNSGKVFTNFDNGFDTAWDVVIQADGKILSVGEATNPSGFALARHNADGSPDNTFGSAGKVVTSFIGISEEAHAVALQSDGKAVIAGRVIVTACCSPPPTTRGAFALARYNLDGSLDVNFGNAGKVITEFGEESRAKTLVVQPDGKLVAAGTSGFLFGPSDLALARYQSAPTNAAVLQTEAGTDHAIALDSVTLHRDPFSVTTEHNFSSDQRRRITLFATNLTLLSGESFSSVSVQAQTPSGAIHNLPVENVVEVPGFEWLTQVVVKLPDELTNAGNVRVTVTLRGLVSNQPLVSIQ